MKYLYIELNYYKRMPLTQADHFSMTIENPIQMILGTNGSGKSSLVKELTPFPPNANDFFKQGSKVVWVEHKNAVYTLSTVFSPSTKHSFVINDGPNLNEGGTLTVQKSLIKEHFNLTQEVNDLLHDEELFTEMSASRRKEWFISLCETDYTYAIKIYNKFKEKHRDTLGALKIAKKRLATETDKVLKTEDENKLHSQVTELHSLLSHLLEYRKPIEADTATLDIELDRVHSQLHRAASYMQGVLAVDTPYGHYSLDALTAMSLRIQQSLGTLNAYLDDHTKQYAINEDKIKILQRAEQNTIDSLESDIVNNTNKLQELNATTLVDYKSNAVHGLDLFQNVKTSLLDICTTIAPNPDKKYNSESLKSQRLLLAEVQLRKQKLIEDISSKEAKLKHLLQHKNTSLISCTKCHHKFSLVYSEEGVLALETQLEGLHVKLMNTNTELSTIQTYIDETLEYSSLYRQYLSILSTQPALYPYWDYMRENNIITHVPREAIHHFNRFESDLKLHISIQSLEDKIQKDTLLLKSLKEVGTDSLQSLLGSNKTIYSMVASLTNKIASKGLKLNTINKLIERHKNLNMTKLTIEELLYRHTQYTNEYIETMRRSALNSLIKQLQSELGSKEHILMIASNQKGVIRNIEEQISELEIDAQALSALIANLSPTDGLIAQGLLGFINSFIGQMNEFIERVWAYSMVIDSCDIQDSESLDLDYKFPVRTDKKETPDVGKCSKGMKEIINLAFKITAMKYLNLLDTPLYLDEFGSTMDNGHRAEVISLIKAFSEQKTFSQMFIVSHDVTQYSSLPNAQVCVVCSTNIITPQTYNEHVIMR